MEDAAGYDEVLRSTMQKLTASFAEPNAVDDALGRLTAAAVELMQRVDYADLMLIDDGEFRCLKPASPLMVKTPLSLP